MVSCFAAQPVQESIAAYVAHELRTPLAIQRALLELALTDASTDAAAWREIGEDVLRACRQQERLLESCLALARSRAGARRCEAIDLATIAADALRAHDCGEIERILTLQPARTSGDPDLVERLAANLVSNAIRHNVAGGRIEVMTRAERERSILSVANTGPRIPVREIQRLFQPFQQFGPNARGLGLGLAIVRSVADVHDARVAVRPRPGGGLAIDVAFRTVP